MNILDEYMGYADDSMLTECERAEVRKIVNGYKALDMDLFVQRVGGMKKIEEMRRINNIADGLCVVDGVVRKRPNDTKENIEEWKRGFMEGFEEAYKRLNMR